MTNLEYFYPSVKTLVTCLVYKESSFIDIWWGISFGFIELTFNLVNILWQPQRGGLHLDLNLNNSMFEHVLQQGKVYPVTWQSGVNRTHHAQDVDPVDEDWGYYREIYLSSRVPFFCHLPNHRSHYQGDHRSVYTNICHNWSNQGNWQFKLILTILTNRENLSINKLA